MCAQEGTHQADRTSMNITYANVSNPLDGPKIRTFKIKIEQDEENRIGSLNRSAKQQF